MTTSRTVNAITFNCYFITRSNPVIGSVYECSARVSFDGNENVTEVSGNHESGKGHSDVQGLYLQDQNLPFFPTNIEEFFPNLVVFDLQNNAIVNISNRHLKPFPSLQHLYLTRNRITSLDSNIFSGMMSMSYISFNINNIHHVGHDINLPKTGELHFNNNPCISQQAVTPEQIATLKLNLLRNCPPTISQIENTLESRPNLLTTIDGRVQSLINKTDDMDDEMGDLSNVVSDLSERNAGLEARVAFLEEIIENKLGLKVEQTTNKR